MKSPQGKEDWRKFVMAVRLSPSLYLSSSFSTELQHQPDPLTSLTVLCFLQYEKIVPDYNFGTLIRTDSSRDYAQDNTTLGSFSRMLPSQSSYIDYHEANSLLFASPCSSSPSNTGASLHSRPLRLVSSPFLLTSPLSLLQPKLTSNPNPLLSLSLATLSVPRHRGTSPCLLHPIPPFSLILTRLSLSLSLPPFAPFPRSLETVSDSTTPVSQTTPLLFSLSNFGNLTKLVC